MVPKPREFQSAPTEPSVSAPIAPARVKQWMGICTDGIPFVLIALTIALVALKWGGVWVAVPMFIIAGWVIWFFRDPDRKGPADPDFVLSPADGTVIDVSRVPYPRMLSGEATRISIFMSIFNVHVNRIPFSGLVKDVQYNPGKYFKAYAEKASLDNEQTSVLLETHGGIQILFVQIAGFIARRIICRVAPGEKVWKGERYGLIRFGSRCDVYFPDSIQVAVQVGEKTQGGKTVLGKIKS
jgi:phosphatidylserine decarboxylase